MDFWAYFEEKWIFSGSGATLLLREYIYIFMDCL